MGGDLSLDVKALVDGIQGVLPVAQCITVGSLMGIHFKMTKTAPCFDGITVFSGTGLRGLSEQAADLNFC